MKKNVVFLAAVLLWTSGGYLDAAEFENSCIHCHQALPVNTFLGSKYQNWKGSLHAREGINCDRCHGGKPSADQKELAHTGVYNSSNPLSRVYYKNVPGTCGACHRRDFNAFKRSAHFSLLERRGAGPTCVTCHESHSTRIISPQQLPATCEQCHNERMGIRPQVPGQAQALLLLIDETSLLVQWARERIPAGDQKKLQGWSESLALMEGVKDEWHAFNLKQAQVQILKIYEGIKSLLARTRSPGKDS
jgi:Cytochrome c3